jgi:glyoxylase-like metal-dependent hydrolase (beta-lactamase superfamily II)
MTSSANREAVGVAAVDGVRRIAVPTPFSVGTVNAYLLEGEPLTLIDAGPATAHALLALEEDLAGLGHGLADVELVILTHGHVDHAGLASILAGRYGAQLACLAPLADELAVWHEHSAREDDYAADTMVRHGVPPQVVSTIHAASGLIRGMSDAAHVDRRLNDGDLIGAGSRRLRVHHRPGHSRWDAVLVDEHRGVAFLGDHLIAHTSSNATLLRPTTPGAARVTPLLDMRRSLRATQRLALRAGLPGHGEAVDDVVALAERRIAQQDDRAEALERLLRQLGPCDAHTLANHLLGERAITQALLAVSEIVGHLDLLIERGRVIEHAGAALCQFEAL